VAGVLENALLGRQSVNFSRLGPTPLPSEGRMAPLGSSPPKPGEVKAFEGIKGNHNLSLAAATAKPTGQRAAYNPNFGAWLMGFPAGWLNVVYLRQKKGRR
jgi:hypothetical protein